MTMYKQRLSTTSPSLSLTYWLINRNDNNAYNKTNKNNNDKCVLIIRKMQVDWYGSLSKSAKSSRCIDKKVYDWSTK